MSVASIVIICVVAVVALAIWLSVIAMADRNPAFRHPHLEPRRGRVQGGTHVGAGRSVSPRREESAERGNPMDL